MRPSWPSPSWLLSAALLVTSAIPARGQSLIAGNDRFGIPFGAVLVIEAPGVLDNDTLDGEPAADGGVTVELVTDASHGVLVLASDGSFSYGPGASFDGLDSFIYRASLGAVTVDATVTLSACTGGPDVFACWNENAFLTQATELGYATTFEGFEDDVAWAGARSPSIVTEVTSQGVRWRSNHPDPPASNGITTGPGPARTGEWAVFDIEHGYATGTPGQCDIDNPPLACLYHDGFGGEVVSGGRPLHGIGGYITGTYGANVAIVLDGDSLQPIGGGHLSGGHQFFGVIDARPAGFTAFSFLEQDGKVGQALFIFGDDVTLLAEPLAAPVMPVAGLIGLAVLQALVASLVLGRRQAVGSRRPSSRLG